MYSFSRYTDRFQKTISWVVYTFVLFSKRLFHLVYIFHFLAFCRVLCLTSHCFFSIFLSNTFSCHHFMQDFCNSTGVAFRVRDILWLLLTFSLLCSASFTVESVLYRSLFKAACLLLSRTLCYPKWYLWDLFEEGIEKVIVTSFIFILRK